MLLIDALRKLEGHVFDVIITDLRMPEMDGFGLLEAVKRKSTGPEVILLTGTHAQDMGSAIRALRLGAHDFLTKPPAGPRTLRPDIPGELESIVLTMLGAFCIEGSFDS